MTDIKKKTSSYTEADNNQFKYNYSKALTGIRVYN